MEIIADRAEDLVSNDTHAASSIDSISANTIGTGLTPQSRPKSFLAEARTHPVPGSYGPGAYGFLPEIPNADLSQGFTAEQVAEKHAWREPMLNS